MATDMKRTTLYMDKERYKELKEYCASRGISMNSLIKVLVDRYMREVKQYDK